MSNEKRQENNIDDTQQNDNDSIASSDILKDIDEKINDNNDEEDLDIEEKDDESSEYVSTIDDIDDINDEDIVPLVLNPLVNKTFNKILYIYVKYQFNY